MSDHRHRWKRNPAKWDACGRLEQLGAVIGAIDESTEHVEFQRHSDGTPIDDADIAAIVADMNILEDATTLDLSESIISDASAYYLGQLRTVTALYLSGTSLTDASIPHLAAISTLRELVLSGTAISDSGLVTLASAKGLKFLQIYEAHVSDAGVAQLEKALPELVVAR